MRGAQLTLTSTTTPVVWAPDPKVEHGEVFTRGWVVDLILDLVGYRSEEDLGAATVVEPSCGCGAFLIPIIERLTESCRQHGRTLADLGDAISGFDLLSHNAEHTRKATVAKLLELGESISVAEHLAERWVTTGDFLLSDHRDLVADFVVGNPPYVRLEQIPDEVSDAYRSACSTMRGRADLFVGFFEKGLALLRPGGRLGFICADRWMRNQYGARLRQLVGERFAVETLIEMHDADAFEAAVSAYPAITVIRNAPQGPVRLVEAGKSFDESASRSLAIWLRSDAQVAPSSESFEAAELRDWPKGSAHWPSGAPSTLEALADLESRFRPLEDPHTGTRVSIGVATGCDDVYVSDNPNGIEDDRLLPILTAGDIADGEAKWSGKYLINPWRDGRLVDLAEFPGLAAHLRTHESRVRSRHVARRRPSAWYRTIDRVTPGLLERPKLLLPDIKSTAHPVLDDGRYYPHHNLYYVISDTWDLEVLGGLLLSDLANLFVGAYCVKMRGGTYRFQAQYLRKIRVPLPASLSIRDEAELRHAFQLRDRAAATCVAERIYGVRLPALPSAA
ncbi:MAG: N-6 DNA methylase [Gammaproteobacteria bacterium]|nr:N-6 DNA methylase [Gammaproteobacteria bacterium]